MRASKQIAERMKNMLVRDKMGVGEGFTAALKGDVEKLLDDYFTVERADATVELNDDGKYEIRIVAIATAIKSFSSTADMQVKRNI